MKIVSVDVMQVPSGNAGSSRGAWSPVVVRVNTDEGISGFGEVGLAYGKGWRAGFGMVQDFAEQIIGMDPMNNEQIWETIFRKTFWGMGGRHRGQRRYQWHRHCPVGYQGQGAGCAHPHAAGRKDER